MRHPQSRRSFAKDFAVSNKRRASLFIAFAAIALVCVQVSTSSVASRVTERSTLAGERRNVRVRSKQHSPQAARSATPLTAPMAAIDVDRTDDVASASACTAAANDCSLRGAVAFANSNPGTIINLPAGTYSLNIPGGLTEGFSGNNGVGDLDVRADNTSIVGAGASTTTIQQTQPNDRVIEINPFLDANFDTSISGVTITGGRETTAVGGGGIISGSINNTLTLTDCVFTGNSATGAGSFGGGGVAHTGGGLTVTRCTFSSNSTSASGGAISYSAGDPLNRRPSVGTLSVTGSSFSGNSAGSAAAGGGALDLYNFNGGNSSYNIGTSSFTSNNATNGRGGAAVVESGPLTIQYSRLVGNAASGSNGNEIYAGGATAADDNWWGVNSGPTVDDIAGPAESPTTIWLQLRHSADPNTICTGGSATLNADIRGRNGSNIALTTELNGLPAFPATFVNGTPALGSVSGASASFVDGAASATFTAGASTGNAAVDVTADSETQAASIAIQTNATTDPADQTVCEGSTATFTTSSSGPGTTTYVWKFGTTVLNDGDFGGRVSGATTNTLTISNTQAADAGSYTVEATGDCNTSSQTATLTVNTAPVVTEHPTSQTVTPGNNVTFSAAATGSPTPTVQWQVSTDGGGTWSDIPGATSTSYSFTVQASDDGNQYRAVFSNVCDNSVETNAATLNTCIPPAVTGSPASVAEACVGSTVNFFASATGDPTPTVQWQVSTGGGPFTDISGATSTTLSVTVTPALNGNQYRAVFTNECGSDTTAPATLGVDSIAPVITLNPTMLKLWPPNHSYQTFTVSQLVASVTDSCGLDGGVRIASVSSDEPENGPGDGNTTNDIVIANDCQSVQLRAERQEGGNGRVYRINLSVTDTAGNIGTVTAYVYVPVGHDDTAIDDGPAGGYTVSCPQQ